ncbi:alanine racemase [uncultured Eubacterium sp.]|uniref:alanine racemase n=1 Tax=uncultured Eubacterium sp. TaxID=165185 RepID=UPI0025EF59F8|nr:alanine racemase [uncultured Eubacterium sp.]
MYFRTQAKIDLDAVEYNYNNTRAKLPQGCKLLGVIKADAYGHGAVELARFLENKCDFFGVACIEEAVELKKAGIKTPILILGYVAPAFYDLVVKYDIRIPVFSYDTAKALSDEAVKQGKTVPFHFCIDTGMSRIGFQVNEESADICKEICALPNIEAEGLFSHFATADESDLTKALAQREKYKKFVELLESRGIQIPIKHLNNSAGIMNFDEYFDMCRMGIILYGLYPSEEVDKSLLDIKPVMSWLTHISHIKTIEAGREVSYGGTFKTTEPRVIATIPVGYADGYPRCLSNKGRVIINGQYAPIVGRVCMDQFMVDVTDVDGAELDSIVTLVGKDGDAELSMEEVSNAAYSFNYELPCRVARRVPRTYYKDGKFIKATNYMY